jgi:hypothetical protein
MELVNPMFASGERDSSARQAEPTEIGVREPSKTHWVFIVLFIVALGALSAYGYLALKKKNIQISQLFSDQPRLNALTERINSTEGTLRDLTGGWETVAQRVTALEGFEGKVSRSLQQTRKYAENLTDKLHEQVTAELQARTSVLDSRLREVESEQAAQQSELAQAEQAEKDLRQEIASVREEAGRGVSGIQQQTEDTARNLGALAQRLDRKRVDFEASKGRTTEIVPGVSLQILGTNSEYQRFRGSLWLLSDRRTVWLNQESVNQPVRFYSKESTDPYELIVTGVRKRSVTGFLMIPAQQAAGTNEITTGSQTGND